MNALTVQNNAATMPSLDFLNDYINPARLDAGESLLRNNKFIVKICDELDLDKGLAQKVQGSTNQFDQLYFNLNYDQMMLVGMRESKAVRKSVLAKLKELKSKQTVSNENLLSNPAMLREALLGYTEKVMYLETKIVEDAPKVAFAEKVSIAPDAISVAQAAKILGTGQQRLFSFLRQQGWISRHNEPYQVKIEQGILDVKISDWTHPTQGLKKSVTTLITGKGLSKLQRLMVSQPISIG